MTIEGGSDGFLARHRGSRPRAGSWANRWSSGSQTDQRTTAWFCSSGRTALSGVLPLDAVHDTKIGARQCPGGVAADAVVDADADADGGSTP